MGNWLQGQMDYIFFFCGLAFIGLGVVAYILAEEPEQRLPWGYLGLFALAQGINEWLDLLANCWPDGTWFAACQWILLAVSFLCLAEFGRLSLIRQRGRGPGRWILGILFLASCLGVLWGWSGLNATTRYALGLVGSLWTAWAFWAEGRQAAPRGRPWLLMGGVGFMLYGLATGVVVPRAGFFPAAMVNYGTFAGFTGLPIQLLRGMLALGIAAMTAAYFQVTCPAGYEPCHRYRARSMYGVGAALAVILVAGWVLSQFLGGLAWQQVRTESLFHNRLAVQRLAFEVEQADEAVKTMAGSPWIGPALWSRSSETIARANSVLDRYQKRFGASVVYLMDQSGVTLASSNRGEPDSFVGKNYAFRPYFQEAMAGQAGRYFALGVTSKKRGFYASFPVRDPAGKICGVAVIKMTLNRFQQDLKAFDPAFLIDPHGIVFVASRPNLDYNSLWPVKVNNSRDLKAQYGTDRFSPIFPKPLSGDAKVEFAGQRYLVTRQHLAEVVTPGWTLVNLELFHKVLYFRLLGIVAAFLMVVLTLVFAGTNLSIREGANRIMVSEARFRAMFTAAPEAVYVYDPKTRKILDANPFMAQWLGYDPSELINLGIDKLRAPEGPDSQEGDASACARGPNLTPGPRYRKKDGSLVDVECTAAQISHGDHIREIVFVRDVTARKQTEADLAWDAMVNASIADLSRALLTSLPLEEIASLVYEHARKLTGSKLAFCGHINPQTGTLVVPTVHREAWISGEVEGKPAEFHQFSGLWGWVLEHGQPLLTNHPDQDPRSADTPPGHQPIHRFLSVPAMIEDQLVGQIALANADRDYDARDQEVCERLANLYAMAIHRQRMEESLRESESGLQTILDNVQTGVMIVDPATHIIVDANPVAERMIGVAKEHIIGSVSHKFICAAEVGRGPITDLPENLNDSERILRRADGENRWVLKTVVQVTLKGKNYLLESFIDITDRRQWEEAIQTTNDKLHAVVAQVEQSNRIMTLANEMADLLQACQKSEEAYDAIGHFMPRFFPDGAGALYMLNNSRNLFEAVASWGKDRPAVPVFTPDECWAVRRGQLHKVESREGGLLCRHVAEDVPGGYLCVPLMAQGETLGLFHVQLKPQAKEPVTGPAVAEDQLALTVAEDMALALANLRLRETLRTQAIRDSLTGLFNRRYMEETMERELIRVKRQETSLGVIMMDLDHFKKYNDTYGHSAGDRLLAALGSLVTREIRGEDIACRYGGEEFLLIMPGTQIAVAVERAEILRQAVKDLHLHHPGLKPTTLSLGVAAYPNHGDTVQTIIQAADAALYRAKQGGRDRVMVAEPTLKTSQATLLSKPSMRLELM
jgi:diguanylate cyclase (GGDEF)-like protein/PAS domain S-box-containing protein